MNNEDKHFIKRYEELLDKGYCDCNEMNCIDNNSPRRILNIVKDLQKQLEAYENMRKEVINYIEKHIKYETDDCFNSMQFCSYHLYDFSKGDLLNILNKVGGSDE